MGAKQSIIPVLPTPVTAGEPTAYTSNEFDSGLTETWERKGDAADYNIEFDSDLTITTTAAKKEDKGKKKEAKLVFDKLKINMANERTFTRWVVMGMQTGAIGTFVLLNLEQRLAKHTIWGVITLGFAWAIGFALALYGIFSYYKRRKAIISGTLDRDPSVQCSFIPYFVIFGMVAVVTTSLFYVGWHRGGATGLPMS